MRKILLIIVLTLTISGCSTQKFSKADYTQSVTIEESIFDGNAKAVETELSFNIDWISKENNSIFNPELGKTAAILCADSYFRSKDLDKGVANRVMFADEEYDTANLFTKLGFSDYRHIESFKEKEY